MGFEARTLTEEIDMSSDENTEMFIGGMTHVRRTLTLIIAGPPGSGKTTLTGMLAALLHWRSCDLEAFDDGLDRLTVVKSLYSRSLAGHHEVVIGAAGSNNILCSWKHAFKVLLLPSRQAYKSMLENRAKFQPGKLGQGDPAKGFELGIRNSMAKHIAEYDFVCYKPSFTIDQFAESARSIAQELNAWLGDRRQYAAQPAEYVMPLECPEVDRLLAEARCKKTRQDILGAATMV